MVELKEDLVTRIKHLPNFLPETVEKFINEYKAETELEYPTELLSEILIRLKPFFKINKFNYFTNDYSKDDNLLLELFKAFHTVCNITSFEIDYCANVDINGDIAFITCSVPHDAIVPILENTKNVVIIEYEKSENLDKFLKRVKKDHVVIKYPSEEFSVIVIYKNFAMFD